MTTLLFCTGLWLGYLAMEALRLSRWRETIPVRVTVTGTRGKSSVVRMLAAALREDGWRVLAKTTGAEAVMILPDGSERRLSRRGPPSILEQVGVVGTGARLGVDALVVEVMSLHPENHEVESRRILRPHLVLATNFRVDHPDAHGTSSEDVARVLARDVPAGVRVLVPREEVGPAFREVVERVGGRVEEVEGVEGSADPGPPWLEQNLGLVRAGARVLGAEPEAVERGIRGARQDLGALRCWMGPEARGRPPWLAVNAFAANDPESTLRILEGLLGPEGRGPESGGIQRPVGLLLLRGDRGDRSALWARALAAGALSRFRHLYVHGLHARALQKRLVGKEGGRVEVLRGRRPEGIMARVTAPEAEDAVAGGASPPLVFGFGNLGGLGEGLVRHWAAVGTPVPWSRLRDHGLGGPHGT